MATVALPTGRPGRLLALALTFAVIAFLWFVVGSPLAGLYQEGAQQLEEHAAVADRMDALAALLPKLKERAAEADAGPPTSFTIEGTSDAVAAATLQNIVQEMASAAGANPQSVEILPGQTEAGYRRVGIKVTLNAPWTVLVALLRAIGSANTPLLVDDLEIHVTPTAAGQPENPLDATLSVYGFRTMGESGTQ